MAQKTHNPKHLEKILLAVAALKGFDWAIQTLESERVMVLAALDGNKTAAVTMSVQELVGTFHDPVNINPSEIRPKRRYTRRKKAKPGPSVTKAPRKLRLVKPPVESNVVVLPRTKMLNALKTVLADGPKPIKKIALYLRRHGVTEDVSPETKKRVVEFITADKTFSTKTRGVYGLRSRAA
jgi:hypothetical protein